MRAVNGERSARCYDITFSPPKSVSTLWALGDDHDAGESLAAHDAAVRAVLDFVERHATTRATIDGAVQNVEADGLAVAAFRQHTSRSLDPQLHTHAVVVAKVRIPDGRWLALDARLIKHDQRTLSSLDHATLRGELTHRLGVLWQTPENGIAEIDGMPHAVLDELSQRTRQVAARLERKLDRFHEAFDRDPTPRELWRLQREAVLDSRPAKQHPGERVDLRGEWEDRVEGLGLDPRGVVDDAIGGLPAPGRLTKEVQVAIVDQALVLVDGPIDAAGLYVPMTRGRDGNDVWVAVDPSSPVDAVDVLADVLQQRWVDQPAIERLAGRLEPTAGDGIDL